MGRKPRLGVIGGILASVKNVKKVTQPTLLISKSKPGQRGK